MGLTRLYGTPEREYEAFLTIEVKVPVRATDDSDAYDQAEDEIYDRLEGLDITDCRGWADIKVD